MTLGSFGCAVKRESEEGWKIHRQARCRCEKVGSRMRSYGQAEVRAAGRVHGPRGKDLDRGRACCCTAERVQIRLVGFFWVKNHGRGVELEIECNVAGSTLPARCPLLTVARHGLHATGSCDQQGSEPDQRSCCDANWVTASQHLVFPLVATARRFLPGLAALSINTSTISAATTISLSPLLHQSSSSSPSHP